MKVKPVKKKDCDKLMQELIHRQNELGNIGYSKNIDFLNRIQSDPVLWPALNFLHAKEYVSITLDINKVLYNIQIEDAGITYFEDYLEIVRRRRIESIRYWITTAIAVAAFIKSFFFYC